MVKGKKNCRIHGTYLGYLNFDNDRYWNYKDIIPCLVISEIFINF